MTPKDRARLTRINNIVKSYLQAPEKSPFVKEQLQKAYTKLEKLHRELKRKYSGQQLKFNA